MTHSNPQRMRFDEDEDELSFIMDEFDEVLIYLDTHDPVLEDYLEWITANETVPQDIEVLPTTLGGAA